MKSFENIISVENKACCPKIVSFSEDFYMTFGNCQKQPKNCTCNEFDIGKKLFSFLKNPFF